MIPDFSVRVGRRGKAGGENVLLLLILIHIVNRIGLAVGAGEGSFHRRDDEVSGGIIHLVLTPPDKDRAEEAEEQQHNHGAESDHTQFGAEKAPHNQPHRRNDLDAVGKGFAFAFAFLYGRKDFFVNVINPVHFFRKIFAHENQILPFVICSV